MMTLKTRDISIKSKQYYVTAAFQGFPLRSNHSINNINKQFDSQLRNILPTFVKTIKLERIVS